jgi:hypothetical protein
MPTGMVVMARVRLSILATLLSVVLATKTYERLAAGG